jgi:O-acetylserine/cysteine efflux transporter
VQIQVPFAAILAAVVFKERLHWRRLLGIAIAFLGVLLIAGEPRFAGQLAALALILAAACVWATASIQIKLLGEDIEVQSERLGRPARRTPNALRLLAHRDRPGRCDG